jgi:hypothetical protein
MLIHQILYLINFITKCNSNDAYPISLGVVLGLISVADLDPGSGAFLPPGSGIRIWDEFFPDPGSKGYVFGEIFLRILVL